MKKERTPWTWYKVALVLTYPIQRLHEYLENEWYGVYEQEAGKPHGWPLFCGRMASKLERFWAIPFIWMGHRGDCWTFVSAIKCTICLLFNWRTNDGNWHNAGTVAWFSKYDTPNDHSDNARAWTDITVTYGKDGWFAGLDDDSSDWGYP